MHVDLTEIPGQEATVEIGEQRCLLCIHVQVTKVSIKPGMVAQSHYGAGRVIAREHVFRAKPIRNLRSPRFVDAVEIYSIERFA
jgi:hypothetical protein